MGISFLLFFCLFLIKYSIFGFSLIHSIACLSFFSLFFCLVCINCFSVSHILLSSWFFFSLLYALCLSLFNILILFKRCFISLGIFFFLPSLFLFGTISIHISYSFSNRYSITSIAFPLLHIFLHGPC